MEFKAYPKIHRLGKDETEGILDAPITVQEKIDGANISIWLGSDGLVHCGSRTRELTEGFNGFVDAVKANPLIKEYLTSFPTHRLYGEWLVKHTITYPDAAYKKIYLYDIYVQDFENFVPQLVVETTARALKLEYPHIFATNQVLTEDKIQEMVGKSAIGPTGEGVVIKQEHFINKFGDHAYAKVVHQNFKEHNAIVFGGNNKHSETYWEMYIVNKYCTVARVQKIMNKIQPTIDRKLHMEQTSQVANTCYHDLITEEAWEIAKKVPAINYKALQRLCMKKFIQIYHDILNNSLSIADSGDK